MVLEVEDIILRNYSDIQLYIINFSSIFHLRLFVLLNLLLYYYLLFIYLMSKCQYND